MTREEILKDPGYVRLTTKQKAFVTAMTDNGGDKIKAAADAFKCKDRYSAVTMASKCLRNLVIRRLIDAYFGEKPSDRVPNREELAAAAWDRAVNSDKESDALKWFALTARVMQYDKGGAEEEPIRPSRPAEDKALIAELEARGLHASKSNS